MEWPSVSLITYCKGRLHHLQRSLPYLLDQDYAGEWEVLIVDYDCPDGTWGYVQGVGAREPRLKALRLAQREELYNRSRARNLGAHHAQGEILALIDVDRLPVRDYLTQGVRAMHEAGLQRCTPSDRGMMWGDFFVTQQLFQQVRGQDESFAGWGWEDIDQYYRLDALGAATTLLPPSVVEMIHHDDRERVRFCQEKDPQDSAATNLQLMQQRQRRVNPGGFGTAEEIWLYRARPIGGWELLRDRYPWPRQRPLLPADPAPTMTTALPRLLGDWFTSEAPELILHLGSGQGRTTQTLLHQFPEARLIAMDPWTLGGTHAATPLKLLQSGRAYPEFLARCWEERQRIALCRNDWTHGPQELASLPLAPQLIVLGRDASRALRPADIELLQARFPQAVWAGRDVPLPGHQQHRFPLRASSLLASRLRRQSRFDQESWLLLPN